MLERQGHQRMAPSCPLRLVPSGTIYVVLYELSSDLSRYGGRRGRYSVTKGTGTGVVPWPLEYVRSPSYIN